MKPKMRKVSGPSGAPAREAFEPRDKYPHAAYVEAMRSEPGEWFELEDLPPQYAPIIRLGKIRAYQPAGDFTAVIRNGRVRASYIGDGTAPPPRLSGYGKYNHDEIRRKVRESEHRAAFQPEWPRSYVTAVRRGEMGYTKGEWEARYYKDVGVLLTWLGTAEMQKQERLERLAKEGGTSLAELDEMEKFAAENGPDWRDKWKQES